MHACMHMLSHGNVDPCRVEAITRQAQAQAAEQAAAARAAKKEAGDASVALAAAKREAAAAERALAKAQATLEARDQEAHRVRAGGRAGAQAQCPCRPPEDSQTARQAGRRMYQI